jgi:hypothetical protein
MLKHRRVWKDSTFIDKRTSPNQEVLVSSLIQYKVYSNNLIHDIH